MTEVGTYLSTPSTSVRGCSTDPSKRDYDIPASPHDSQVTEESGPNQGSDGGSTSRPGEKHGQPPFKCPDCPTRFTQEQSLNRHLREQHQPGSLKRCLAPLIDSDSECPHKWIRDYDYRNHLRGRKHQLDDDEINKILGPPSKRDLHKGTESDPPPRFSPPPIKRDRQSPVEPPLSLVMPYMAYSSLPQLGHAEVTTTEHDVSPSELKYHAATHAPSSLLSDEDSALLRGHYEEIRRRRSQSAQPVRSTIAYLPPNPGTLHIPVDGHHTCPVSEDPMAEPSRSTDPMVVDYREIGTDVSTTVDGCRVDSILADACWAGAGWAQLEFIP